MDLNLRILFKEILDGYTKVKLPNIGTIYYKHPDLTDFVEIEQLKEEFYKKAVEDDIPTDEQQLQILRNDGLWDDKKDEKVRDLKNYLKGLYQAKEKLALEWQIKSVKRDIENAEKELAEIENEKAQLMGITAELAGNRAANSESIRLLCFDSKKLDDLYFSEEEFNDLDEDEFSILVQFISDFNDRTDSYNIKRVALTPFFCNLFFLCDNNPLRFYGRPLVDLSLNQADLFRHGCIYKNIMTEQSETIQNFDDETLSDPDKFEEATTAAKRGQEMMDKLEANRPKVREGREAGTTKYGIVGATKKDLERMGGNIISHKTIEKEIRESF